MLALADRSRSGGYRMESSANQITQLLQSWSDGDEHAIEKLMPLVYNELHRMARRCMSGENPGHTLQATAMVDPGKSQIVELRFFGGLNVEETAEVARVSPQTVNRDWKLAKSWLRRELSREQPHGNRALAEN
jgi:DNA-directed RNA polymerase specialized sigma subunit